MKLPELRFRDDNGQSFPEWNSLKLAKLADIYDGTHMTPDYKESGIPFYSVEHITSNNFSETKFIAEDVYNQESKRVKLEKGDILMTRIGDIGTPRYIDWDVKASFYVSLALIKQSTRVNSQYLAHYISSSFFQKELHQRTIHVAFPKKINLGEIGECLVALPKKNEQSKIANFLTAVDEKITQLTQKCKLLAQYKKGVMQQIFSQELRFKDDDGQDFPEWTSKMLSNVAFIVMGSSPQSESYNYEGNGLPLIQGNADIKDRKSAPRIYTTQITKECLPHDILLSVRAPVGTVAISRHHACIGRGICAIRAKKEASQGFLYQYLLAYEHRWKSLSQGSTFEAVNSDDIKSLELVMPHIIEQDRIANFLNAIDDKLTHTQNQLAAAKQYKQGLLQQMFI